MGREMPHSIGITIVKGHRERFGFKQGKASPCIFDHTDFGVKLFVHGDDYVVSGKDASLKWFK